MYRSLFKLFCFFVILLSSTMPSPAAVLNATNVTELQAHLTTAAANGQDDTINVAAGTYNVGTTLFHGGLESFSLTIAGAGASTTFLDGGNAVQVMSLRPNGDLTVSGLTIRNGDGTAGGNPGAGLEIQGFDSGTTTTISDCIFSDNANSPIGGGLYVTDDNVTVTNSSFTGNTLTALSGPGAGAFIAASTGMATISSCTFSNNGDGGTSNGGGLNLDGNAAVITDSTFSGNIVSDDGMGGGLSSGASALTITGSTFSNNSQDAVCDGAPIGGGAAAASIESNGTVVISGSTFSTNNAPCGANLVGGALGITQHLGAPVTLVNNIFFNNVTSPGLGTSAGSITLRGNSHGPTFNLTNNTFSGNDSGDGTADILIIDGLNLTSTMNVYNNIFWGGPGDDTLEVQNNAATPVRLFNNDIDMASVTVANTNDYLFGGNQNIDPLFVNQTGGDLHLTETSSVIDMGLNTAPAIPAVDIDGDTRILDGTVDMGADEFTAAVVPPPPDPPSSTFNPGTGVLVIPELQLRPTKAYRVELVRLNEPGYVFELQNFSKVTPTSNPAGTFSLKTGVLDLFAVQIGASSTTWHVLMQKRPGVFVFDMTKARKN